MKTTLKRKLMKNTIKKLIAQCKLNHDYFIDHCLEVSEIKRLMEKLNIGQEIIIRTPDNITITIKNVDGKKTSKVDWAGGSQ